MNMEKMTTHTKDVISEKTKNATFQDLAIPNKIQNALEELGMEVTTELVSDVMTFVDKDGDGTVSEEEFVKAIAKRSTRRTTEERVHKHLIDLVPKHARERKVTRALSNSFGFGGTNASLVVGKLN